MNRLSKLFIVLILVIVLGLTGCAAQTKPQDNIIIKNETRSITEVPTVIITEEPEISPESSVMPEVVNNITEPTKSESESISPSSNTSKRSSSGGGGSSSSGTRSVSTSVPTVAPTVTPIVTPTVPTEIPTTIPSEEKPAEPSAEPLPSTEVKEESKHTIELPYFNDFEQTIPEQSEEEVEEEIEEVSLTDLQKYELAAAEQGITIAEYFNTNATTALDKQLLLYPYSDMDEYPVIRDFTLSLTEGCTTEESYIETIYNWINSEMTYDYSYVNSSTYNSFINRAGVCSQFSTLMHDMLSAVGIQSYYVSGVVNNTEMSEHQAINSYYYNIDGKHAWILAKIDGGWKYYDPTIGNYAMSANDLAINNYSGTSVDSIHCLPETYEISNTNVVEVDTEAPTLILRDNDIKAYRNSEEFNEYKYRNLFNGDFYIYKETYSVITYTTHLFALTENAGMSQDEMFSGIIWYQASCTPRQDWTDPKFYRPEDYGTRFWIYTSTGRKEHGLDVLQYLISITSIDEVNAALADTVFTVKEDGLYITHNSELCLLETFEEHNKTICHYNFLD